eukprot:FR743821.1.p1 GENE.FR743821.1~~FR743821.1.p1  ORF type:complete len:188 (+),score=18.78 FR743821.1:40-564(+)
MARQSEKKAKLAAKQAEKRWFPVLLGINIVYIVLRFGLGFIRGTPGWWAFIRYLFMYGAQHTMYGFVVESSGANAAAGKNSQLAGEHYFDVLMLLWLSQLLAGVEYAVRGTEYSWYLTFIAPIGAAVYAGQFAMGFMGKNKSSEEAEGADVDPELLKKQQRRRERKEKRRVQLT